MEPSDLKTLYKIECLAAKTEFDFHSFFRQKGLHLHQVYGKDLFNTKDATAIPQDAVAPTPFRIFTSENIEYIREHFLDLLMLPHSARILWNMHCSPAEDSHSLLTKVIPRLEAIANVVRGGPNIYKLNGWVVHVLVAYSIVTDYIPSGKLPSTREWPSEVSKLVNDVLRPLYESLESSTRTILHVATLGHDIGIAKGIPDHDKNGVSIVPSYLREINVHEGTLKRKFDNISFNDFEWAVKVMIEFHTFINRIGVEFSLDRSATEITNLMDSASSAPWRLSFLENNFARLIFLLAVGDLIAVDDALLSERKVRELKRGYDILLHTLRGGSHVCNEILEGFNRFRAFLSDQNQAVTKSELEQLISSFGYSPSEFWAKFYSVQEFNFTLSLVPYLPSAADTLSVFLILFYFIDDYFGSNLCAYRETRVVFDHTLDPNVLTRELKRFFLSFDPCRLRSIISQCNYQIGNIKILFSDDSLGHLVFVSNTDSSSQGE